MTAVVIFHSFDIVDPWSRKVLSDNKACRGNAEGVSLANQWGAFTFLIVLVQDVSFCSISQDVDVSRVPLVGF